MTLKDYISKAFHYEYPDNSLGGAERQRKRFLELCKKNGLDRKFPEIVEKNAKWKELADKHQVYFFEDYVKNPLRKKFIPEIRVICVEFDTIPVIKVMIEKD